MSPSTTRARRTPTAGTAGTEAVRRAEGSASVSLADACCIVVSLMAGVRPEAQAIEWEEGIDLYGNPPSVAVLRAYRARGDTKTPKSRCAVKLARMAAGALREWQADQAAEKAAAGSRWQDTGRVFTRAAGYTVGCERAEF